MTIMSEQDAQVMRSAFKQWLDDGWSPRVYKNETSAFILVFEKHGVIHAIGKAYHGG